MGVRALLTFEKPAHATLALSLYVALRWIWPGVLDSLHAYAGYLFEFIFVGVVMTNFRERAMDRRLTQPHWLYSAVGIFGAGLLCFQGAVAGGLTIPFDLTDATNLVLLLALAPVLEELVFRGAIWRLLEQIHSQPRHIWLLTSAAFSFSHLVVWWHVPADFRSFVLFQAAYTLGLGLYCGYSRRATGKLGAPILVHGLFNLGFYLGSWL